MLFGKRILRQYSILHLSYCMFCDLYNGILCAYFLEKQRRVIILVNVDLLIFVFAIM